jgi:hypothetical protein
MAKSAAQRQAEYRARRTQGEGTDERAALLRAESEPENSPGGYTWRNESRRA